MINNLKKSITNNFITKKQIKEANKNNKELNFSNINTESAIKDRNLTLVEEIEEYGFIPSIDKKDNHNAA